MNELLSRHLAPSQIIIDIMIVCIVIGAIDYQRGNKWGLGQKFQEAFSAFFPLLVMVGGIITLAPLLGKLMAPVLGPVFRMLGADPGIFPGMIFSCAMGGYPLAKELANTTMAADFGGLILGSLMGINIVFNVPAALGMIEKEDRTYMARGFLYGFVTIPFGALCGGLAAGYPVAFLLVSLIPVAIVSTTISILIWLIPEKLIRVFIAFGKLISLLALAGIVTAIGTELAGIKTESWPLASFNTDLVVVGSMIIILPGAYVLVEIMGRVFRRLFLKIGLWLGINESAVLGMTASAANIIPTLSRIKNMDPKGKVVNFAFATTGAFTFGDHLGFCAAVAPKMIIPVIIAKLTAAFSAVLLVLFLMRKNSDK